MNWWKSSRSIGLFESVVKQTVSSIWGHSKWEWLARKFSTFPRELCFADVNDTHQKPAVRSSAESQCNVIHLCSDICETRVELIASGPATAEMPWQHRCLQFWQANSVQIKLKCLGNTATSNPKLHQMSGGWMLRLAVQWLQITWD